MKRIIPYLSLVILIAALALFHRNNINKFPSRIHAWSQSDRYALALGFIDNGFDLFHPQTYNLTESPYRNPVPHETSITAVDFPINDFVAALLMKLFGTTDPWCFRIYTFLYSLIGMCFLFLLAQKFINNNQFSMIVVLFCVTSPVYLYYQVGFLPTIPAISNLFIGLYYFFKYQDSKQIGHFSLGVFFITIAVLSRKPFLFFLLALFALEFWDTIKSRKINIRVALTMVISTLSILSYFLYNRYLGQKYGMAFLGFILPPDTFAQTFEITTTVFKNWLFQYFTVFHYIALSMLVLASLAAFKKKIIQSDNTKKLIFCIAFTFIGYAFYYVLMMKQFPAHDYYFLDSFYAVVCLLVIYLTSIVLKDIKTSKALGLLSLGFFLVFLFTVNKRIQLKREETGFWDRVEITTNNFEGAETLLNENNIPQTAKILVLDSYTTNIPFIKMKRFGYALLSEKYEDIKNSLTWRYDYIVLQDCYTSEIINCYPPLVNEIDRIAGNGKISIYKKQTNNNIKNLLAFLKLDTQVPILVKKLDFDSISEACWSNVKARKRTDISNSNVGFLAQNDDYSTTLSLKGVDWLSSKTHTLVFSVQVYPLENPDNVYIVTSIASKGEGVYFNAFNLSTAVDTMKKWQNVQLVFPVLPQLKSKENELKVFIWNAGKKSVYFDNFKVAIY